MFVVILVHLLGIVGFFVHLFKSKEPKTPLRIVELFLVYQLVFSVGLISLMAFIALTFMPEMVARVLAWPTCPFQQELGNVNLAFGVLGIMCIWFRGHFWTATVIGLSIWLLGDAYGHIEDAIVNHNYSSGNVGVPLWTDIIVPVVFLVAWWIYLRLLKIKYWPA